MVITRYGADSIITWISWARWAFQSGWHIFQRGRNFSAESPLCLDCLRASSQPRSSSQWRLRISAGAGYDCVWAHVLRRRAVGSDVRKVWRLESTIGLIKFEFAAAFPALLSVGDVANSSRLAELRSAWTGEGARPHTSRLPSRAL